MKITLTNPQYCALDDIYGPPENVHDMIMRSRLKDKKWTVEGADEDFDDLLSLISEEIGEGMCSNANIPRLLAVCKKVDPGSIDWIGM